MFTKIKIKKMFVALVASLLLAGSAAPALAQFGASQLPLFQPQDPTQINQPLFHLMHMPGWNLPGFASFMLLSNIFKGAVIQVSLQSSGFLGLGVVTISGAVSPVNIGGASFQNYYTASFKMADLAKIENLGKAELLVKENFNGKIINHRFSKALNTKHYQDNGAYWRIREQETTSAGEEKIWWNRQNAYTTRRFDLIPGKEFVVQEKLKINAKSLKTNHWIQNVNPALPAIVKIILKSGGQPLYEIPYFLPPTARPQRLVFDLNSVDPGTYQLVFEGINSIYLSTTYSAKSLWGRIKGLWQTTVGE